MSLACNATNFNIVKFTAVAVSLISVTALRIEKKKPKIKPCIIMRKMKLKK